MTPSLLLDTHVLVWWRSGSDRLDRDQSRALLKAESRGEPLAISAMTLWELARMVAAGKLEIKQSLTDWLEEMERNPAYAVLPITARIAASSIELGPDFHNDPAGRMIVATARCHGLKLVTADRRIHEWGRVQVV